MDTDFARQTLKSSIDADQKYYVDVLRSLVSWSAQGEDAVQQDIAERLERLGCQVDIVRNSPNQYVLKDDFAVEPSSQSPERPSVVGRMAGAGDGRSLLLFAHPDSEPIAATETWTHSPFAGEVVDGRMYGWGVADDLAGVAAMICGLEAIREAGLKPSGSVIIASTVSKRRAQGIYAVFERGYEADAAIYLHPAESGAGLGDIKAASSGILRFRLTVSGQPPATSEPTHTPFYHRAVNPIDKAWVVYNALNALAEKRAAQVHHPAFADVGRSTNLHISYLHSGDEARPSRVSSSAVMAGSLTFPPNEDIAEIQASVAAAIQQAAESDPWLREHPPRLDWLMGTSSVEVPLDSPIYRTVHDAIQTVTGLEPSAQSLHSGSDIRAPILFKGIPTVGFGPLAGDLTQAGGTDEWVSVDDYIRMIQVVASVIVDWCGVTSD